MTTKEVLIRDEKKSDLTAISNVTIAAFEKMGISNHTEHFVTEILTAAQAPFGILSCGDKRASCEKYCFFTVTMLDGVEDWYGLGSVSLHPDLHLQRRSFGCTREH